MKLNTVASKLLLSVCTVGFMGANAFADTYKIDSVHSSAVFKVKHLNVANVHGRFNDISGTVNFDAKNPAKSSVMIEIDTNTVDTKVQQRDDHLRSPDFFNVKEFPKMSFKSTSVKKLNNTNYQVKGNFNLHGVTKPITINFVKTGEGKGMKGEMRAGGETSFKIKRSDYGMKFMPQVIGNDIDITIAIEGIKE